MIRTWPNLNADLVPLRVYFSKVSSSRQLVWPTSFLFLIFIATLERKKSGLKWESLFWSLPVWNDRGSVVCILKSMKQDDVAPTINSEHKMLCINHVKSVVAKCLFLKFFVPWTNEGVYLMIIFYCSNTNTAHFQ